MAQVSLIIPVYNKAPFLERCFISLVNQTNDSAQIILVDDESTDGSDKICKEYSNKYKWEYYRIKHSGVSEARNYGLKKVKGNFVAFLDGDDALLPDAIDTMVKISRHDFNIYQFGQYRCKTGEERLCTLYCGRKGHRGFDNIPKHWVMIWNKLYKVSFLKKHRIKFPKDMPFGEDEIFSAKCILANGGLYQAPQSLVKHFLDDKNSICRGSMCLDYLKGLDKALADLEKKQIDPVKKRWLSEVRAKHKKSKLFREWGFDKQEKGHYDIIYFLKECNVNEELRYSLRSVEENWQYNKVWFYGGRPRGLKPDYHIRIDQTAPSKWERVRGMLREACLNENITEDFWLFNDDFFILQPKSEKMPPQYNKTLQERVEKIEKRHNGETEYTKRLKHLIKTLEKAGKGFLDYSVHKPILINRKKMLEVLDKFPDEPMSRALYGNYWEIGGVSRHDMKIEKLEYDRIKVVMREWDFVSTSDNSFQYGSIGRYLRDRFDIKSRFEI